MHMHARPFILIFFAGHTVIWSTLQISSSSCLLPCSRQPSSHSTPTPIFTFPSAFFYLSTSFQFDSSTSFLLLCIFCYQWPDVVLGLLILIGSHKDHQLTFPTHLPPPSPPPFSHCPYFPLLCLNPHNTLMTGPTPLSQQGVSSFPGSWTTLSSLFYLFSRLVPFLYIICLQSSHSLPIIL